MQFLLLKELLWKSNSVTKMKYFKYIFLGNPDCFKRKRDIVDLVIVEAEDSTDPDTIFDKYKSTLKFKCKCCEEHWEYDYLPIPLKTEYSVYTTIKDTNPEIEWFNRYHNFPIHKMPQWKDIPYELRHFTGEIRIESIEDYIKMIKLEESENYKIKLIKLNKND